MTILEGEEVQMRAVKLSLQTRLQEKAERVECEQKIKYKIDFKKVKGQWPGNGRHDFWYLSLSDDF